MAFGDRYKTAWRDSKGRQVEIVEGRGSDGPSFCMFQGDEFCPLRSRPQSLNAARALVAIFALGLGWHADIVNAEVGLFDKDGKELPDPDEEEA